MRHLARSGACLLALWLALAGPASAQVWGFVDPQGAPHFAGERVDARYALLYAGDADVGAAEGAAAAPARLLATFEVSIAYKAVRHLMREAAAAAGLEYELLKAVVATESGFDPKAVSPRGAIGLMQLMPDTASRFGVHATARQPVPARLTDPRTNLQAGARYLAWLLRRFDGQTELALAAYNAGEGAVQRYGNQIPPFAETQRYVRTVSRLHQLLRPPATGPADNTVSLRERPGRVSAVLPAPAGAASLSAFLH